MGASKSAATAAFAERLSAALAPSEAEPVRRWLVAFSGGIDSTVLLHVLKEARPHAAIEAVHFDHGWHPDSAVWSARCESQARHLGVGFIGQRLGVADRPGGGLEAAAREARYAALAGLAGAGDVVLTAHNADDQLETVLLRLLRGSGVSGLTGIHAQGSIGGGRLARPLLDFSRREIEAEARRRGLDWIEDPGNADLGFDRNFLRHACLPRLKERWPQAGLVASRLARHMAEADELLTGIALQDLASAGELSRIPLSMLRPLSGPRLNNALRQALRSLGLPVPTARQLAELRRLLTVRNDAEGLVSWPGAEARVYREHLYLLPSAAAAAKPDACLLDSAASRVLAAGELRLVETSDYGIPDRWVRDGIRIRYREGGERFQPARCRHSKLLKHWFQESGIVPWMRASIPLLYRGDRIIAVADLELAAGLPQNPDDAPFWRPVWTGHARLR